MRSPCTKRSRPPKDYPGKKRKYSILHTHIVNIDTQLSCEAIMAICSCFLLIQYSVSVSASKNHGCGNTIFTPPNYKSSVRSVAAHVITILQLSAQSLPK